MSMFRAVPWVIALVTSLSPHRPRFSPRQVHVRFMVDKLAVTEACLQVLRLSPGIIISTTVP